MDKKGSKFNYDSYTFKNDQSKPFVQTFNKRNCRRTCICSNYNENKCFDCFKCNEKTHNCTKVQINRPQIHSFECMSCLARSMDLIYQPQIILLETFFRTENIFQKANCINFEFSLNFEDIKFPVDVRCFKGNKIELVWPMQGEFYLNQSKSPIFALKPLKSNSNRKNRKQDNFLIPPQKLREGLNTLTFKIPRLQKNKFIESFQYEEIGTYYLALYSVKELSNQQVLNITQRQRRHQKSTTLKFFNSHDQELVTQKQKVLLIDPYTCERIKFPVRGRYCKHLSIICLLTYISFQKHSRSWKCPICTVQAGSFINEPYLDVWLYEILKQKQKGDSVIIYANGMHEWQDKGKQVVGLDDSDDSDSESISKKAVQIANIIEQQQPLQLAMQNIDLQSHSLPQQQLQIIQQQQSQRADDLYEYEYVIDDSHQYDQVQNVFMEKGSISSGQMIVAEQNYVQRYDAESQGQISDGYGEINMPNANAHMNLMQDEAQFNQQYPLVSEVHIEDDHIHQESRMSSSASELQYLAAQNEFIPPSIISNIVPSEQPEKNELKNQKKLPQIYSIPLEKNQKNPVSKSFVTTLSNIIAQKITKKQIPQTQTQFQQQIKKNETMNKISIPNKNLTQSKSKQIPNLHNKTSKLDDNKRQIQRPNFLQFMNVCPQPKSTSLPNQKPQPISLGKPYKKNIQYSQSKQTKTEPKKQPNTSVKLSQIFPKPKILKNEEMQPEKPQQIETMKFNSISHSRFVKNYCNIPIPPLMRKMNDDMKRLFRNILEFN